MADLLFSRASGRFHDAKGRFVSAKRVSIEIDAYLEESGREASRLSGDLRAGRVSLEMWREGMRRRIRTGHVNLARIAKGGRIGMTPADNGRVGQVIRREYGFLERWVEQIKAGWILDGRLEARAQQYTDAPGETFDQTQREEMRGRGMDVERNVLDPTADHCVPTPQEPEKLSCPQWSARGWLPLGTIPLPKSIGRICRRRCRCHMGYDRQVAGVPEVGGRTAVGARF